MFFSEVRLEEKEEYEHYLRINPECFDQLLVLVMDGITYMRDASSPKLKLAAKIFHVHSFVVVFS